MKTSKLSFIIPAFNEEFTITDVIKKIRSIFPDTEIIVKNDGSGDNTAGIAQDAGAVVLMSPTGNERKSLAFRRRL